jgi:hypothetical protein
MISAQGQKSMQERLIHDLMALPNSAVSNGLSCRTVDGANIVVVGQHHCPGKSKSGLFTGLRNHQDCWQHYED